MKSIVEPVKLLLKIIFKRFTAFCFKPQWPAFIIKAFQFTRGVGAVHGKLPRLQKHFLYAIIRKPTWHIPHIPCKAFIVFTCKKPKFRIVTLLNTCNANEMINDVVWVINEES